MEAPYKNMLCFCVFRKVWVRSGAEVNSKSFFFYLHLSVLLHGP